MNNCISVGAVRELPLLQFIEFVDCQICLADQFVEQSWSKFFVLGNG